MDIKGLLCHILNTRLNARVLATHDRSTVIRLPNQITFVVQAISLKYLDYFFLSILQHRGGLQIQSAGNSLLKLLDNNTSAQKRSIPSFLCL